MKRIFNIIMIFLLTATISSYAGIYRDKTTSKGESSEYGALYRNAPSSSEGDSSAGSLFRSSNNDLDDRPGNGTGIGQEAPIGNGIRTLAICCLIYGIIKLSSRKGHKNFI